MSATNCKKTRRYLITSLGSIGRRHLANLRQLEPGAQIAALRLNCSLSEATTLPDGVDFQFSDLAQAIAFKPHAVIIASPASVHMSLASAFISTGVPILIEKPLATSTSGLKKLISENDEFHSLVRVAYNLRCLPSLAEVRTLLHEGKIGNVLSVRAEVGQYLPDWRPNLPYQNTVSAQSALGGGALLELSHEVDYIYWMFGLPKFVVARGGRYSDLDLDVEDVFELVLQYVEPNRLVNIHLDFLQRAPHRSCRFIGSEGTIIWDAIENSVRIYCASRRGWECKKYSSYDHNKMYVDELSEFIIKTADSSRLPGVTEAYNVLAIIEAAKTSMSTDRAVVVEGYDCE